jgi:hypothetical protein
LLVVAGMVSDPIDRPNLWALTFSIPALVFLAALLFGCATPQPIYRLEPNGKDVVWVSGRASVQQEREGIRVAAAFDQQHGDTYGMRVEIFNGTEERLEVGPQKVWFSSCSSPAVETCSTSRKVIDPERVIASIDAKRSVDRAAAANSQAFLGTMVLLNVVGDVANIANGRANRTTGLHTMASANLMASDAANRSAGLSDLSAQRQMWSNEALRRNSLFPAQGTGGEVFFPIEPQARFVWLQVRVGKERFAFHFQQEVRHPEQERYRGPGTTGGKR